MSTLDSIAIIREFHNKLSRDELIDRLWRGGHEQRDAIRFVMSEIDSLRGHAKKDSAEIDRLQGAVHELEEAVSDSDSRANEIARALHEVREQRDQLLAQLDQLCVAVKSYRTGHKGSRLREVMSNARNMIAKMKTP